MLLILNVKYELYVILKSIYYWDLCYKVNLIYCFMLGRGTITFIM